jgi:hypothetical protein
MALEILGRAKMKNRAHAMIFVMTSPAAALTCPVANAAPLPAGRTWSDTPVEYQSPTGKSFKTHIECAGPGTGLCWKRGHDPRKGQPPLSTENWKECG